MYRAMGGRAASRLTRLSGAHADRPPVVRLALYGLAWPMSQLGQNAKYSSRVNVFRFASKLRRRSVRSALRICANSRLLTEFKRAKNQVAQYGDFLEPIQKVIESNESFVIPCVAPESQMWDAACGSLNTVVLPITVAFAIRAI
jgi:hypothetical protein